MIKVYDENRTGKEVVRIEINTEESFEHNMGKTASFIIRALAIENKEVYVKFISSTKKLSDISLKTQKMLIILNRMIKEGLETAYAKEPEKIPQEYRKKKLLILSSLPYVKDTEVFKIVKDADGNVTKVAGETKDGFVPKATIIRLYLAEKVG